MIGFVVVAHWSDALRPRGNEFLLRHVKSIYDTCQYPFKVYVIDNQSEYKFDLSQFDNISYTYIEDQNITGITGAWNLGIDMAFNDGCDMIVNGGDDMYYNDTVNELIKFALEDKLSDNRVYAPLSDGVTNNSQLANSPGKGHFIMRCTDWSNVINGFLFLFTKEHYSKFKISTNEYFNLSNPGGKWHGQENQWVLNSKRGLEAVVIRECWLQHEKQRGWKKLVNL
jgi:hypothetical protein